MIAQLLVLQDSTPCAHSDNPLITHWLLASCHSHFPPYSTCYVHTILMFQVQSLALLWGRPKRQTQRAWNEPMLVKPHQHDNLKSNASIFEQRASVPLYFEDHEDV